MAGDSLAEATEIYQAELEKVRMMFESAFFDDEDRDHALEDLGKAKDALEVAWLEHSTR